MLDSYMGQLEGMFASDPLLVFSSLLDKDIAADKDGTVPKNPPMMPQMDKCTMSCPDGMIGLCLE